MKKTGKIYMLSHPQAGRYIGQTTDCYVSNNIAVMREHAKKTHRDSDRPLFNAFRQFGFPYIRTGNWNVVTLYDDVDIEDLDVLQIEEIDKRNANLNFEKGGMRKGFKKRGPVSEKYRDRMREAAQKRSHTPETIEKIRNTRTGKKHSQATRNKMSKSQRMRHANAGHKTHGNTGRKHREETIKKMQDARKKQIIVHSKESRKKISDSLRGRHYTCSNKAKAYKIYMKLIKSKSLYEIRSYLFKVIPDASKSSIYAWVSEFNQNLMTAVSRESIGR